MGSTMNWKLFCNLLVREPVSMREYYQWRRRIFLLVSSCGFSTQSPRLRGWRTLKLARYISQSVLLNQKDKRLESSSNCMTLNRVKVFIRSSKSQQRQLEAESTG